VRFGRKPDRKQTDEPVADDVAGNVAGGTDGSEVEASAAARDTGPFDVSEVDVEELDCIDLGSLLVRPPGPLELQLQVDEESGDVLAVVLVGEEGALELRAFAASRGGGAWDELRPRIAAEMARMGGTSDEQQGSFGTELRCVLPVQTPEGGAATQSSRIVGYEGPTWLLRATLMGRPAVDEEAAGPWEETIRQVVVRRGREAMPPGAPLPLTLPPEARRVE
jgi:hypothetical protein